MRQLYEEHLLQQHASQPNGALPAENMANHLLQIQAKQLAQSSGMDVMQALQMLKSQ